LLKSINKLEYVWCDHKTSRTITCCAEMREIFVWGAGYLQMRRVGIRKKKEK
jgi:hypothetical protein